MEVAPVADAPPKGSKMNDMTAIDASPAASSRLSQQHNALGGSTGVSKSLKRKRAMAEGNVPPISECRWELDELFEYYKEVSGYSLHLGEAGSSSLNSAVGCLLEESSLPFSRLVDEIHEKLKARDGNQEITLSSIRSTVLFVGQRVMYGVANADADVLEDESQPCLWCWETRDMKLLPTIQRGILNVRRVARNKIHERISALSVTISALSTSEGHETYKSDILKACDRLGRALKETAIRSLVQKLKQKNDADIAEKGAKLKEKELAKEFERNKRNAEKEQKRMARELQKEKLQTEKEIKQLQDEAMKEEKRREKEEAELKKQLKKQQEDSEREQRRREKEEYEHKKQLALKKQATMMERFLKRGMDDHHLDNSNNVSSEKAPELDTSCKVEDVVSTTTSLMDHTLLTQDFAAADNILRSWRKSCHSNRSFRWGVRRNPKIEVVKELKLQGPSSEIDPPGKHSTPNRIPPCETVKHNSKQNLASKLVDGGEETVPGDTSCDCNNYVAPVCTRLMVKKLLQFDKSHRPAYYGTWSKKSSVVCPQHPFKKDPELDYDIDSDEEWEEEDPGESLSDCDKDDEEEHVEGGNVKSDDEDESEDGFFVPDGYLSENEGMETDSTLDDKDDVARSPPSAPEIENEEFRVLLRLQKHLHNLTEQALRKSQTLVIFNLMHEKSALVTAEGLSGTAKLEQICLQALCMRTCHDDATIDNIPMDHNQPNVRQEGYHSISKCSATPTVTTTVTTDSDLPEVIASIRSFPHGINKVVESLQRKFPSISKTQLKNKVREVSEFVDNRWLVKKEVLDRLGISPSPEECRRPRGIIKFFSKRCLSPTVESISIPSSQPCPNTELPPVEDRQCSELVL